MCKIASLQREDNSNNSYEPTKSKMTQSFILNSKKGHINL